MLEKYLQLLDKLKEKKFSQLLSKVRRTMVKTLLSDTFSEDVHAYLSSMKSCDLVLMPTIPTPDTLHALPISSSAAYVRVHNDERDALFFVDKLTHQCIEITLTREKRDLFDAEMQAEAQAIMLSEASLNKITFITGHRSELGEPCTNFSHEPEQISQVKKIINALYHGELALIDTESV
ncbi:MAG: hypothetical protein ACOYKA_06490, partial [Legionellaceae bacterium]